MKSFVTALAFAAILSVAPCLVEAQSSSYNSNSSKAFKVLLANSHVHVSFLQEEDPAAKPVRVSSLLEGMLTTVDENATYLAMTTQTCVVESADVVSCELHILSSDRESDLTPKENMTESSTAIQYKVNVKTMKLIGKPTYFIAG